MAKLIAEGWLTVTEAATLTGYSPAYLRGLANRGRVEAHKVGRDWFIALDSIEGYKSQMDALGDQRHNPWRRDLAQRGRGRRR